MNQYLEKIFHGVLLGIGFSIVVGTIYYFLTIHLTRKAWDGLSYEATDIQIVSHKKVERNGEVLILGQIKNVSASKIKGITLQIDLFDNDEFVKQCIGYIRGALEASAERNFQVACGDKNEPVVPNDSYTIYVTG